MISLYQDIMISLRRFILRETRKKERTKQVQFRMPEELHLALRKALLDNGVSMADLFNDTAKNYIKKHKEKKNTENKDNG